MKEATKVHQVLDYVLSKAVLKQKATEVTVTVNYSDLCNQASDRDHDEQPPECPSMVDLVIKITTSFDTRKEMIEFETQATDEEDDEKRHNPNADSDKEGH